MPPKSKIKYPPRRLEPKRPSSDCPLVALGASAGGLESFQEFFQHMPHDSGMAFFLIQHLDPKYETLIPELLSRHTSMPVVLVEDGQTVRANNVYVVPPGLGVVIENCALRLARSPAGSDRVSIDSYFKALAENHGKNVVAIILSGTGSDGTIGLRAIKEHGGLTVAQSPETAKFDGMPRGAISGGCVDLVLPIAEMPKHIIEYVGHLHEIHHRKGAAALQVEAIEYLPRIFPILRQQTGHDFSRYRQSTVLRRIQRRMQLVYLDSVSKYVAHLRENPIEVESLFKDLLIGVTEFFRDEESFNALDQKVLPAIFEGKGSDDSIRVWIPGCASGEEAYTFAILLSEQASAIAKPPKIQIFATDLDAEALEIARKGRYSAEVLEHVSSDRLRQFFKKVGSDYEVADSIRRLCTFSAHNLIKDPPFSHLDLLSCRNVLIYLEVDLQKKLLPLFHYSLNANGYLFLGPAENVANRSEFFRPVDNKHRIFQRKPSLLHSVNLPVIDPGQVTKLQAMVVPAGFLSREQGLVRTIERVIIDEYAPASAVINSQGDVLYFTGETGKFLEPPSGVPTNKLLPMARKNIRLELRTAVHRAITSRKEVVRKNLIIKNGRKIHQIDLVVRPLFELTNDAGLFVVLFRDVIPAASKASPAVDEIAEKELPFIRQLEAELRTTKDDLQATIEELEISNEELKSANEELLSMNEEFQSANEELQTSKEEVQSANEELNRKIEEAEAAASELRRAHEDRATLAAIVQNSDDAIISKTLDGIITSWNPAAERMFGYSAKEIIGQSIVKIIPPERLEEETQILGRLRRGEPIDHYETQRISKDGRRVLVSLTSSPLRDAQGIVIGASKIARDITFRAQAEQARLQLAAVVESTDDAIITKSLEGVITSWNKAAERLYGYSPGEVIGKPVTVLIPADRHDDEPAIIDRLKRGEKIEHYETLRRRKDGTLIDVSLTVSPLRDHSGTIIGASKIARDITGRKQADQLRFRLAAIIESSDDAIVSKTLDGTITTWNRGAEKLFGYTAEEIVGRNIRMLFPPDRLEEEDRVVSLIRRGQSLEHFETVRKTKDGRFIDISLTVSPIKDTFGKIIGASKIARDITDRRHAEEARARLAAVIESSDDAIITKTLDGTITSWNRAAERMYGYSSAEAVGKSVSILIPHNRMDEEPAILDRLKRGEKIDHYETLRRRKDGSLIDVSLTVSPLRDGTGRIMGAAKIARDISGRKQAEEARLRLAAVVESSDDAIISKTLEGHITSWNKGAQRIFGYTSEEVVGKHITILFPPDRLAEEENVLSHVRRGEPLEHFETVRKTKDGQLIDISLTVSPIKDALGKIIGASKIARDITERKRAQAEIVKVNQELEERVRERTASLTETNEQLETFCYTIAHDLRSPLRAQQSFAQALLDEFSATLGESGKDYAWRILRNAERLDHLVSDLLAYSRMSRDQLKFAPVDLRKVAKDVIDSQSDQIQSLKASVKVGQLHPVIAYEPTLTLVLTNLVANALKFAPPGDAPDIRIHSEVLDSFIRLWVEDSGIGIAPENIAKIFGIFHRLHPIDKYPGTGIGLAIVQKGVERMGGRVGVESELNRGSKFWIELPAV